MSLTSAVEVPSGDREVLAGWLRSPSIRAGLAQRARIVLLAADGIGTGEIASRVGTSKQTVISWKNRYRAEGVGGLDDRPKPGRPQVIDEAQIVVATLEVPPGRLGVTHWSSRLLAAELGLSHVTIIKVWKKWNLQPWRLQTFKFSTDPELDAKVRDVVGLYLNPPEKAVVVCVDEKTQIQALDRTAPILPLRPGLPETTSATAPPACSPRSRSPPAKSPTAATTGTPTPSSWTSSNSSPAPTPAGSCTSSATTTPPTSTQT